jgi:2-oxo-4-hydroxy-4-carboxy--5-ureidoimidazoline (OHCU) decarboxylase
MSSDTKIPTLPPVGNIVNNTDTDIRLKNLDSILSLFFESSEILTSTIVPAVNNALSSHPVTSYTQLIDLTLSAVRSLPSDQRAKFIGGHPRIGEVKNLSAFSAAEQTRLATPPAVLERLAYLNAVYERRYPGLVYITFVNGRSRTEIAQEMEQHLGISSVEGNASHQTLEAINSEAHPVEVEGIEWLSELDRAVEDIARIAFSRFGALGAS